MKLKLKMIAVAAAIASIAGASSAQVTGDFTQDGTLVVQAVNLSTGAYYIRDLGYTINSFLPSGVLASAGDPGSLAVGDKTPVAGLLLNATSNVNFSDTLFSTWLAGQTLSSIRWNVSAVDSDGAPVRAIASSTFGNQTASNGQLVNYVSGAYAGSVEALSQVPFVLGGTPGLSYTGVTPVNPNFEVNYGLGSSSGANSGLAEVGSSAFLYYFAQNGASGPADGGVFSNGPNFGTVTLALNGDFTYSLASAEVAAVPLPAAAWLMGAGLMSLAGAMRRRKMAQVA